MPRACSVCSHAEHRAIDQELTDAISLREIAQHYGLSKSAVLRHWQQCAPQHVDWPALARDAQQLGLHTRSMQI
jgi:hypothetical protein